MKDKKQSAAAKSETPNSLNAAQLLKKAHARFEKVGSAQSKALKSKMK